MPKTETFFAIRATAGHFIAEHYWGKEEFWVTSIADAYLSYDYGTMERRIQELPKLKSFDPDCTYEIIELEAEIKTRSKWKLQPAKLIEEKTDVQEQPQASKG